MPRREARVALSAFRHHGHPARFTSQSGVQADVRFIDLHGSELGGEYREYVMMADLIQVLAQELPAHDTGDTLEAIDDGTEYTLGREVATDGYVRTIEVTIEHVGL